MVARERSIMIFVRMLVAAVAVCGLVKTLASAASVPALENADVQCPLASYTYHNSATRTTSFYAAENSLVGTREQPCVARNTSTFLFAPSRALRAARDEMGATSTINYLKPFSVSCTVDSVSFLDGSMVRILFDDSALLPTSTLWFDSAVESDLFVGGNVTIVIENSRFSWSPATYWQAIYFTGVAPIGTQITLRNNVIDLPKDFALFIPEALSGKQAPIEFYDLWLTDRVEMEDMRNFQPTTSGVDAFIARRPSFIQIANNTIDIPFKASMIAQYFALCIFWQLNFTNSSFQMNDNVLVHSQGVITYPDSADYAFASAVFFFKVDFRMHSSTTIENNEVEISAERLYGFLNAGFAVAAIYFHTVRMFSGSWASVENNSITVCVHDITVLKGRLNDDSGEQVFGGHSFEVTAIYLQQVSLILGGNYFHIRKNTIRTVIRHCSKTTGDFAVYNVLLRTVNCFGNLTTLMKTVVEVASNELYYEIIHAHDFFVCGIHIHFKAEFSATFLIVENKLNSILADIYSAVTGAVYINAPTITGESIVASVSRNSFNFSYARLYMVDVMGSVQIPTTTTPSFSNLEQLLHDSNQVDMHSCGIESIWLQSNAEWWNGARVLKSTAMWKSFFSQGSMLGMGGDGNANFYTRSSISCVALIPFQTHTNMTGSERHKFTRNHVRIVLHNRYAQSTYVVFLRNIGSITVAENNFSLSTDSSVIESEESTLERLTNVDTEASIDRIYGFHHALPSNLEFQATIANNSVEVSYETPRRVTSKDEKGPRITGGAVGIAMVTHGHEEKRQGIHPSGCYRVEYNVFTLRTIAPKNDVGDEGEPYDDWAIVDPSEFPSITTSKYLTMRYRRHFVTQIAVDVSGTLVLRGNTFRSRFEGGALPMFLTRAALDEGESQFTIFGESPFYHSPLYCAFAVFGMQLLTKEAVVDIIDNRYNVSVEVSREKAHASSISSVLNKTYSIFTSNVSLANMANYSLHKHMFLYCGNCWVKGGRLRMSGNAFTAQTAPLIDDQTLSLVSRGRRRSDKSDQTLNNAEVAADYCSLAATILVQCAPSMAVFNAFSVNQRNTEVILIDNKLTMRHSELNSTATSLKPAVVVGGGDDSIATEVLDGLRNLHDCVRYHATEAKGTTTTTITDRSSFSSGVIINPSGELPLNISAAVFGVPFLKRHVHSAADYTLFSGAHIATQATVDGIFNIKNFTISPNEDGVDAIDDKDVATPFAIIGALLSIGGASFQCTSGQFTLSDHNIERLSDSFLFHRSDITTSVNGNSIRSFSASSDGELFMMLSIVNIHAVESYCAACVVDIIDSAVNVARRSVSTELLSDELGNEGEKTRSYALTTENDDFIDNKNQNGESDADVCSKNTILSSSQPSRRVFAVLKISDSYMDSFELSSFRVANLHLGETCISYLTRGIEVLSSSAAGATSVGKAYRYFQAGILTMVGLYMVGSGAELNAMIESRIEIEGVSRKVAFALKTEEFYDSNLATIFSSNASLIRSVEKRLNAMLYPSHVGMLVADGAKLSTSENSARLLVGNNRVSVRAFVVCDGGASDTATFDNFLLSIAPKNAFVVQKPINNNSNKNMFSFLSIFASRGGEVVSSVGQPPLLSQSNPPPLSAHFRVIEWTGTIQSKLHSLYGISSTTSSLSEQQRGMVAFLSSIYIRYSSVVLLGGGDFCSNGTIVTSISAAVMEVPQTREFRADPSTGVRIVNNTLRHQIPQESIAHDDVDKEEGAVPSIQNFLVFKSNQHKLVTLHDSLLDPALSFTEMPSQRALTGAQFRGVLYVCNNSIQNPRDDNNGQNIEELLPLDGISENMLSKMKRSKESAQIAFVIDLLCGAATQSPSLSTSLSLAHSVTRDSSQTLQASETLSPSAETLSLTVSVSPLTSPSVTVSAIPQPIAEPQRPLKDALDKTERGSSSVFIGGGGVFAPKAGGQASVAMAILRVSQSCAKQQVEQSDVDFSSGRNQYGSNEDGDSDNLDEQLSPFIHPLTFSVGSSTHRYFIGAVIGNCFIIPVVTFVLLKWPISILLQRWGLPGDPSTEEVHLFMGWPSVLVLPITVLAEGTATAVVELFKSRKAIESLVGIAGAGVTIAGLLLWSVVLFRRLYTLPIVLKRVPFKGRWTTTCWPLSPLGERTPVATLHADSAQAVDATLERMAHLYGDGLFMWAELGGVVCSVIVGVLEGAGDSLPCQQSTPTILVFAVIQSLLSCATMVPAEIIVQVTTAVCVTLLAVSAVVEAYGKEGDSFLTPADKDLMGLIINIMSFFGIAVGLLITIIKLLRRRAAMLIMRASGVKGAITRWRTRRFDQQASAAEGGTSSPTTLSSLMGRQEGYAPRTSRNKNNHKDSKPDDDTCELEVELISFDEDDEGGQNHGDNNTSKHQRASSSSVQTSEVIDLPLANPSSAPQDVMDLFLSDICESVKRKQRRKERKLKLNGSVHGAQ